MRGNAPFLLISFGTFRSGLFAFLERQTSSSSEESEQSLRSSIDRGVLGCVWCEEAERSILMEPCMHIALCTECNDYLLASKGSARTCPICRCKVVTTKRVFI